MKILFQVSWLFNLIFLPLALSSLFLYLARHKLALFVATNSFLKPKVAKIWDSILLALCYIPGISRALSLFAQERFTRSLALQLVAGRNLLASLKASFRAAGHPLFAAKSQQVHESVIAGIPLTVALRETELFDSISVLSFLEAAEESGNVGDSLALSAKLQLDNITSSLETVTSLIEPLLLAVVGCFVGGLVIVFFRPVVDLMHSL